MKAIVLFAHGSRDPQWHRPIQAVAGRVQAQLAISAQTAAMAAPTNAAATPQPSVLVACAYLELSTPSLSEAVQNMVDQGCQHIRLVPLFLGVGKHVREDLPQMLADLAAQHPSVVFEPLPAVGEHPDLLDLMAQIALADWT